MEQEASIETTTEEVSPTLEVAYSNSTSPTTLSAASAAKAPVQQTHTKSFINMKIFTSQTSLHSHDQCILNKSELKASRMVHIYSSTCFFLSLQGKSSST